MFPRLGLGGQLLFGVVVGAFVILALAIGGTQALNRGQQAVSGVFKENLDPLLHLQRIEVRVEEVRFRLAAVLAQQLSFSGGRIHLAEANQELFTEWDKLKTRLSNSSSQEQAQLQKLEQGIEAYRSFSVRLKKAYEQHNFHNLNMLLEQEWPTVHKVLRPPMLQLLPLYKKEISSTYDHYFADHQQTTYFLWGAAAIGLAFYLIFSILLTNRIRSRIGIIVEAMRRVAAGDLGVRLKAGTAAAKQSAEEARAAVRQDELGSMSTFFNQMTVSLADMKSRLDQELEQTKNLEFRLKEEVELAAKLQQIFLPEPEINLPGLVGYAHLITSTEVGGDYYDYYVVDQRWVVILAGDVSGHGVASGTVVGVAKSGVNQLIARGAKDPSEILGFLNNTVLGLARSSLLMTMFCVVYDNQTGELKFANAGHQFPYHFDMMSGEWSSVKSGGLPLGKKAEVKYPTKNIMVNPGDRFFLYSDGLVESENSTGEAFGYERAEGLLKLYGETPLPSTTWVEAIMKALTLHTGRKDFDDDLTLILLEFNERIEPEELGEETVTNDEHLHLISDENYRGHMGPVNQNISRNHIIYTPEDNFSDVLPRLAQDGIRRVLPKNAPLIHYIGRNKLIEQHERAQTDDIYRLLNRVAEQQRWDLSHSDDKLRVMKEAENWLMVRAAVPQDRIESLVLILDELLENGLYGAPRGPGNTPLFQKASKRELTAAEPLRLDLALEPGYALGIMVTDAWGTLTPATFLERLGKHAKGKGLKAGLGGGGLFLLWRMSDYLQIRVQPMKMTQISAFLDLNHPFEPKVDKGFQFIYDTQLEEIG